MSLQGAEARRFNRLRRQVHDHFGIPRAVYFRPSMAQLEEALSEGLADEYDQLEWHFWHDPDPDHFSAADALCYTLENALCGHIGRDCILDRDCGDDRCCNPQHAYPKSLEEYRKDHASQGGEPHRNGKGQP